MGKVRVGMARSGLEKRKKMGSRYQTTAEEVSIRFTAIHGAKQH